MWASAPTDSRLAIGQSNSILTNYIRFLRAFQGKPQKKCLPTVWPGDRGDRTLCLFALRGGEAVQNGCKLAAGSSAGGQKLAVGAVDEALADSPLHGGNGVAADAVMDLQSWRGFQPA